MSATGTSIAVAAGVLIPFLISFLKDTGWSEKTKQVLAFVVAVVTGVGITVVDNGVALDNWSALLANLGIIFTTAQVFYTQILQGTGINKKLEDSGVGAK